MNNISILDCTLRDGGYVNNWNFGKRTIKSIIQKLNNANIDIVECGFIADVEYDEDKSLFPDVNIIKDLKPNSNGETTYVGMIALGEKEIDYNKIPKCDNKSITGIRLTFHRNQIDRAVEYATDLMSKGYKLFMQPVGTTTYSDSELLELIEIVNNLNPFAFYIVDTLGNMHLNNLLRNYYLIDNNLNMNIQIGFHSHNNLQLSFSNSQQLMKLYSKRDIIIDSSVFGMGRGAGNLCTELITEYINNNIQIKYDIIPLLEIIDEHLINIKSKFTWGYSTPYYIAAVNDCHPNYATYLMNKQTITVKSINTIIKQIPNAKKSIFDISVLEKLYQSFQSHNIDDTFAISKIKQLIQNKNILILAPGKSLETQSDIINKCIFENNPIVISVNLIPSQFHTDILFVSNIKRFENIDELEIKDCTIICTSNIKQTQKNNQLIINYCDYTIDNTLIPDNAGLMLLSLLIKIGIKSVALAGFDGFHINSQMNYYKDELISTIDKIELQNKNEAIKLQLQKINESIDLVYITDTVYNKE